MFILGLLAFIKSFFYVAIKANQVRVSFEIGDTCRTSPERFCLSPFARDGETAVWENVAPLAVFVHDSSMAASEWFHPVPKRRYCPSAVMVDETLMSVAVFCDGKSVDEWPCVGETARDGDFSREVDISVTSLLIANSSESFGEGGSIFPSGRKSAETFGIAESPKAVCEVGAQIQKVLQFLDMLSDMKTNVALKFAMLFQERITQFSSQVETRVYSEVVPWNLRNTSLG